MLRTALLLLTLVALVYSATEDSLLASSLLEAAGKGDLAALNAAIKGGDSIDTTNVNGWCARNKYSRSIAL
jgi:hypothetical protein